MSDQAPHSDTPLTITAIVCARDAERYLAEALDSILSQSHRADQVIVVDDGSLDATERIASMHPVRPTVLRTSGIGLAAARNLAIQRADGDAITFLDADDLWMPDCLQVLRRALTADTSAMLVFGHVEQFASPDLTTDERAAIHVPEGVQPGYLAATMLARRECFSIVGQFDESLRAGEFIDWLIRCRRLGLSEVPVSELVLRRRHHTANLGRSHDLRQDYVRLLHASIRQTRQREGSDQQLTQP